MDQHSKNQIAVVDFGGQYAHLIASRIRRLGAYSEIVQPDEFGPEDAKSRFKGIIMSGGPSSVYDEGAPGSNPEILHCGLPVLGICYGHQLVMKQLGGDVHPSRSREYGPATLEVKSTSPLLGSLSVGTKRKVWMSHGDEVARLPDGFETNASTSDCQYAVVSNDEKKIYGLQFHPEVNDTEGGDEILHSFIQICGLENTWDLDQFLEYELEKLKQEVKEKKVFMLLSGGVDSTVAFALLARALPADHLRGFFIDTGFMRYREIEEVKEFLEKLGVNLSVADESELFINRLEGVFEPEKKRNLIGELFVDVQEKASENLGLSPEEWFLGQGTIYPDTIESGATKNSHRIKTHHNRVARIERLLEEGRVVEPLKDLYKDEVRKIGLKLGLPEHIVNRHPFPGPGLAVRILCTGQQKEEFFEGGMNQSFLHTLEQEKRIATEGVQKELSEIISLLKTENISAEILPVQSVGVQGDQRSYAHPAALYPPGEGFSNRSALEHLASKIPNRMKSINRVVVCTGSRRDIRSSTLKAKAGSYLTQDRIYLLRAADRIVQDFIFEKKMYHEIWQFPVVLAPVHMVANSQSTDAAPMDPSAAESIILRPILSQDAMTASFYPMDDSSVHELTLRLLSLVNVDAVYYDLTSKPPGTIEWE